MAQIIKTDDNISKSLFYICGLYLTIQLDTMAIENNQ